MDAAAPLPDLPDQTPTWDAAASLAREWELNRLAERLAEPLADDARHEVGRRTDDFRDDQPDRPARIAFLRGHRERRSHKRCGRHRHCGHEWMFHGP
jgi:hypothetical protein